MIFPIKFSIIVLPKKLTLISHLNLTHFINSPYANFKLTNYLFLSLISFSFPSYLVTSINFHKLLLFYNFRPPPELFIIISFFNFINFFFNKPVFTHKIFSIFLIFFLHDLFKSRYFLLTHKISHYYHFLYSKLMHATFFYNLLIQFLWKLLSFSSISFFLPN